MADDWSEPLTVEQMYGEWDLEWDDAMALLDQSLDPRPKTSIYDHLGTLGLGADDVVLDIGGRDGRDGLAIAEQFGCRVIVVDPVQLNIEDCQRAAADHPDGHLVAAQRGSINQIPLDDGSVDLVFSRDMLGHVEDLDGALAECSRVLTPSGSMLIHDVFGTPLLEPRETARLCADLAMVPDRLSPEIFEDSIHRAGFTVQALDLVGSEWMEWLLEQEAGERCLLHAARLNRAKDAIVAEVGVIPFRVIRANNLYTIYRMIGKLEERIYSLTLDQN